LNHSAWGARKMSVDREVGRVSGVVSEPAKHGLGTTQEVHARRFTLGDSRANEIQRRH